jgi:hypothetical protein
MAYDVAEVTAGEQWTAVIAAATTWAELPALWPPLLAEVWAGGTRISGTATRGITEWCDRHGRERAGPRWEVYGHHTEVVAEQTVEIVYL